MDAEAIRDLFRQLGPVHFRRMFGGQGIYQDEMMFAFVAGGELYLKTDEQILPFFQEIGSRPFAFESPKGQISTSYWLMPDSALDDPDEAAHIARMALEAARRARGAASARKGRRAAAARKAPKPASKPLT
jgi:DNA transformation protein